MIWAQFQICSKQCVGGFFSLQVWQSTLAKPVRLDGIGVHSGRASSVAISPAPPHSGIVFYRDGQPVPAQVSKLAATELASILGCDDGSTISTVEHIMASLRGLGIDNAAIDIEGGEVPILDGSAAPFVAAIDAVGTVVQNVPRRVIEVLKPVRIDNGSQWAELLPYHGFKLDIEIDFASQAIGRQRYCADVTAQSFRDDLAPARTFGFFKDAERLRAAGFGLGASLANTVVLGEQNVLNAEGLRFEDEFVRHKALDAIGDLALAGMPLRAQFRSFKGGHKLNAGILNALFIDRAAYRVTELNPTVVRPARLPMGMRFSAPTFTPSRS